MPAGTRREFLADITQPFANSVRSLDCPPDDPAPTPSLAVHAANRLQFGPAPGDIARIESIGYDAFVTEQLNPAAIDDSACDAILAALPRDTFAESWAQLYDRRSIAYSEAIKPLVQVRHAAQTRQVHSKRQLFELMVDFWHNHFNVYGFDFIVRSLFTKWDETIRTHALGNFRTFLEATTAHPCMLYYLDNYVNTDGGPNENYARELFELHTLGAMNYQTEGGYIDQDVYEASRCFTGWTYEQSGSSANRGQFKYVHEDHDRFIKFVLGSIIPGDQPPQKDARDVLDKLAFHEGTARHLATKLIVRFVADNPPPSLVESTAAVFLANKDAADQIKKTVEHILRSDECKNSRMTKFKRPLEWTVSAMRALRMPYVTDDAFRWIFDPMGQPAFAWRPPNGPPDTADKWATSNGLLRRWNWITQIASGWYDERGLDYAVDVVTPSELRTAREIAAFWSDRIIARSVSGHTSFALMEFLAEGRSPDAPLPADQIAGKLKMLAGLCTLTPEFQRR